jgi:nucleoside-diphosphate-sugar epimerase
MQQNHALVIGGLGVAGRHIVGELAGRSDWQITAVARKHGPFGLRVRFVSADVADVAACQRALAAIERVTHVFYAARNDDPDPVEQSRVNLAMLRNVLDAVEHASPQLAHVNLMHGMKAYGTLLGPFKTPALETDPRLPMPIAYYAQEDLVRERAARARWTWSTLRPGAIYGLTLGHSGNLVQILGVYGTLCRELGTPLWYPGTQQGFDALRQGVDAELLARAAVWVATRPACANQAFNISNGDVYRWRTLWPAVAAFFGIDAGPPLAMRLKDAMSDKAAVWERIVAKHALAGHRFEDVASWAYADTFHNGWDAFASDVRLRSTGFAEVVDTQSALLAALGRLRRERIIP